MNLEHVSTGKSTYTLPEIRSKPIQLPIFPKSSLRPSYSVSTELIDRILQKLSARDLCGREEVGNYLRRQLLHNCQPNTIRQSGSTILLFLEFYKKDGGQQLSEIRSGHMNLLLRNSATALMPHLPVVMI